MIELPVYIVALTLGVVAISLGYYFEHKERKRIRNGYYKRKDWY